MKIPENPEFLKSENVLFDGVSYPLLKLEVLPGKQSEITLLNFTWSVVEF